MNGALLIPSEFDCQVRYISEWRHRELVAVSGGDNVSIQLSQMWRALLCTPFDSTRFGRFALKPRCTAVRAISVQMTQRDIISLA